MTSTPSPRRNTGRPALEPGTSGAPWTRKQQSGRWTAAAWVRDANGSKRQVSASGVSKGAALRNLQRKLETRAQPGSHGVQPNWTVSETGQHWWHRAGKVGAARGRGQLKPQTLAAYDSELRRVIGPMIGGLRLSEITVPLLEAAFSDLEDSGMSTAQARSVINQVFALAVRDGAMKVNPLPLISLPPREPREVEILDIGEVRLLRRITHPDFGRRAGARAPNRDLHDVVTVLAGTGARIGEALALRHQDVDLDSSVPTVTISGTMVEPRRKPKSMWADPDVPEWYVETYTRQPTTKTNQVRTLVLPARVAEQLQERRANSRFTEPHHPLLASGRGQHLWAANIRTRLRARIADHPTLVGTTPHTLRRTVASLVAYAHGLDAARHQLGHVVVTGALAHYVAPRREVPDYTEVIDQLFAESDQP